MEILMISFASKKPNTFQTRDFLDAKRCQQVCHVRCRLFMLINKIKMETKGTVPMNFRLNTLSQINVT